MHDPEQVRHQNLLTYCDRLEEQGGLLLESAKKISKRNQGVGQDLSEMVPVYEAISQGEAHAAMAQALQRTSAAAAEMSESWHQQSQVDELVLVEPLRDLVLLVGAAKDVLKNRDAAMINILEIRESRTRIQRELEQAQASVNPSGPAKQKTAFELLRETMVLETPREQIRKLEQQKVRSPEGTPRSPRTHACQGTRACASKLQDQILSGTGVSGFQPLSAR